MSELASQSAAWLSAYTSTLQHGQVHMALAVALYTGSEDIKMQVLGLTGTVGFPAERFSLSLSPCPARGKAAPLPSLCK